MSFWFKQFMCLMVLAGLCRVPLEAQQAAVVDEEQVKAAAVQTSFSDGMFELAQLRAKDFLRQFPASAKKTEIQLTEAKSLYYLGLYQDALKVLSNTPVKIIEPLKSNFLFWQGETLLQLGKWIEAEKKYRDLLDLAPTKELQLKAQLGLAWALLKQDKESDAHQILDPLVASEGKDSGEAGYKASILLARMLISKSQEKEAAQILEKILTDKPPLGIELETNYWLGEIDEADNRPAEAIVRYHQVTGKTDAYPRSLVAQAWFGTGICEQKMQQHDQAMQAFEQAYTIGSEEQLKLASFNLYLESAKALQRLPEAVITLRAFAEKEVMPTTASAALFAIGLSQAEQKQTDLAIGTLEDMLTTYPKSIWKLGANFCLGDLYRDKDQSDLALKCYKACVEDDSADETPEQLQMQQEAIFKIGEIYYSQKDFTKAAVYFQKAADSTGPSAETALFNLIQIQSLRSDLDGFTASELQFEQRFPKSPFLGKLTLEKAKLLENKGMLDKAREAYQDALAKNVDPAQRPFFLLRLGELFYNSGQYEDSLKMCEDLITNYPKDTGVLEATYKAIWCNYLLKRLTVDQARTTLLDLYKKFPQDPLSAAPLFNAAEFSYNAQNYPGAQALFEELVTVFPQNELVDQSLYYAGRSAANFAASSTSTSKNDYSRALELLEKVKEGSPFKVDARILEGDIYRQQFNFETAITLFDEVLTTEKSGPRFVEATLQKGHCLFALGSNDNAKYEQAAAAFGTILINPDQGNLAQRNEAAVTRAKCFEKLDNTDEALAIYLDVLNGHPGESVAPVVNSDQALPPEIYWRVQAGESAAEIREKNKDWAGALAIYRKLQQIGGPLQEQFTKDIDALRREHFLYDDGT